jgi:hypothetical protein
MALVSLGHQGKAPNYSCAVLISQKYEIHRKGELTAIARK